MGEGILSGASGKTNTLARIRGMQTMLGWPPVKQGPVDALEGMGAEPPPEGSNRIQPREDKLRGDTPKKSESHLDPPFNLAEQQILGEPTLRKAGINKLLEAAQKGQTKTRSHSNFILTDLPQQTEASLRYA